MWYTILQPQFTNLWVTSDHSSTNHSRNRVSNILSLHYNTQASGPISRLLESWFESCWLPFSDDALLDNPDWSLLVDFLTLGLYSVIMTVTLLTVTSLLWAVLRSIFFSLGGWRDFLLFLILPSLPIMPPVVDEPPLPGSFLMGLVYNNSDSK